MLPKKTKKRSEAQERRARLKGEIAIRQRERRREKFVPSETVINFLTRMRAAQLEYGRGQHRKLLKKEWTACFPTKDFPNGGTSLQLIELKVGYWLQDQDIKDGRRDAPSDMDAYRKKYRAAQRLDAAAFPGILGVAVRSILKVENRDRERAREVFGAMGSEKEGNMAAKKTVKKKATPKVRKPSARGMVLDLLVKNNGAKLSDAALAGKVQKAFPDRKGIGAGYVSTLRKQLNAGDEKKKHGTPKPAIKQYGGKVAAAPKKKVAKKTVKKKAAPKKGGAKKKATRRAKKS